MDGPKFPELAKVRVTDEKQPPNEGFVIKTLIRDGRRLYKVSVTDPEAPDGTFDNWYAEDALELAP